VTKKRPLIGITLDWENTSGYSIHAPWYALRDNYIKVVSKYGAIPVTIPHEINYVEDYINMIDALIITGGDYDIDPAFYSSETSPNTRIFKNDRVLFESKLLQLAIAKGIPVLGICAGEQLMAVVYGGTLIQDISTECGDTVIHEQSKLGIAHTQACHKISIVEGSLLHALTGVMQMEVNSTHHQAVKTIGPKLKVSAQASDGIIEAIEMKNYPFCLGVQWHPEFEVTEYDSKIFKGLIEAAMLIHG
jgi:putative glutamine amidotransferase